MKKQKYFIISVLLLALLGWAAPAFAAEELPSGRLPQTTEQVSAGDLPEAEALLEGFLEEQVSNSAKSVAAAKPRNTRGSRLQGNDRIVYNKLRAEIEDIAEGNRDSSVITIPMAALNDGQIYFTAEELGVDALIANNKITQEAMQELMAKVGFDFRKVVNALLADLPYDFYWYDKTIGANREPPKRVQVITQNGEQALGFKVDAPAVPAWTINFYVSKDYSVNEAVGTYSVDRDKTRAAKVAAENAADVIDEHSMEGDMRKLLSYKEYICQEASYNYTAAEEEVPPYGDPWQMIHVFDNDPDTEVVCEGYSKAFQFLCDMTTFNRRKVESHIVTGLLGGEGATGAGAHMWNVVYMGDQKNYLVDVTNCDDGDDGDAGSDNLFLKGAAEGSALDGYTIRYENEYNNTQTYRFSYDSETIEDYDEAELTLSMNDYVPMVGDTCLHELEPIGEPATCTEAGTGYYQCSDCEYKFADAECLVPLEEGNTEVIPALGHHYKILRNSAEAATCTAAGRGADKQCSRCKDIQEGAVIPATGHDMTETAAVEPTDTKAGNTAYFTCGNCGKFFSDAAGVNEIAENSWVLNPVPSAGGGDNPGGDTPGGGDNPGDNPGGGTTGGDTPVGTPTGSDTPTVGTPTGSDTPTVGTPTGSDTPTVGTPTGSDDTPDATDPTTAKDPVQPGIKAGQTVLVSGAKVKVLNTSKKTVAFVKAKKNAKKVVIPKTVQIKGKKYKLVQINASAFKGTKATTVTVGANVKKIQARAFSGSKVKTVILKTKLLNKAGVKGSLKGSKVKTISIKIGRKAINKKYISKYKKYFTKKNAGRKVTVK